MVEPRFKTPVSVACRHIILGRISILAEHTEAQELVVFVVNLNLCQLGSHIFLKGLQLFRRIFVSVETRVLYQIKRNVVARVEPIVAVNLGVNVCSDGIK